MTCDRVLKVCLLLSSWTSIAVGTIDVNLPELQYISDHLHAQECRRLVAALHFHSYDLPANIDSAELRLSKETPCIRLLLHWNGSPGEGKSETHEILARRLRQIGREDLSDWLGRTVFHQLGRDMERSLDSPFKDFLTTKSTKERYGPQTPEDEKPKIPNFDWIPLDTISYTAVLILVCVIVGMVGKRLIMQLRKKKPKRRKKYSRLGTDEECYCSSDSESDTGQAI